MQATKNIGSVTMPAGRYWVGDPCYAVPNERWMEWLEAADYESERRYLLASLDDQPVLGIGTAYGDGEYEDQFGETYPVDAGLIGLTPASLFAGPEPEPFGSHLVEFASAFVCSYSKEEGLITLGHIEIKTDPRGEDSDW